MQLVGRREGHRSRNANQARRRPTSNLHGTKQGCHKKVFVKALTFTGGRARRVLASKARSS